MNTLPASRIEEPLTKDVEINIQKNTPKKFQGRYRENLKEAN